MVKFAKVVVAMTRCQDPTEKRNRNRRLQVGRLGTSEVLANLKLVLAKISKRTPINEISYVAVLDRSFRGSCQVAVVWSLQTASKCNGPANNSCLIPRQSPNFLLLWFHPDWTWCQRCIFKRIHDFFRLLVLCGRCIFANTRVSLKIDFEKKKRCMRFLKKTCAEPQCQKDGTFEPGQVCTAVNCGPYPDVPNGSIFPSGVSISYPNIVKITCNFGYEYDGIFNPNYGDRDPICTPSGKFSVAVSCTRKSFLLLRPSSFIHWQRSHVEFTPRLGQQPFPIRLCTIKKPLDCNVSLEARSLGLDRPR